MSCNSLIGKLRRSYKHMATCKCMQSFSITPLDTCPQALQHPGCKQAQLCLFFGMDTAESPHLDR